MFGLSLAEIVLLVIVGIVVVGPRNVPDLMRQAGRWIAKIRRMSVDLRSQSGIDDLIRHEGLEHDIAQLRSLSRVNVIDTVIAPMVSAAAAAESSSTRPLGAVPRARSYDPPVAAAPAPFAASSAYGSLEAAPFAREVPELGCDAYGALPDDADPYRDATEPDELAADHEVPVRGCDAYGAFEDAPDAPALEGAAA